jgi:hypothetical protein
MIRNLKALGLALVALCALGAVMASAASAVTDHFTSPKETTILTGTNEAGTQTLFFSQPEKGAEIPCKVSHYAGTFAGQGVTEVTVHPKYTECEAKGIGKANVTTSGCDYLLTGATDENAKKEIHATVHLECTTGKSITFEIPSICTLHYGAQTPTNGVTYTNTTETVGGKTTKIITANITMTGVTYTKTGNFCGLIPGNGKEGVLKDNLIFTGYEDLEKKPNEHINSETHEGEYTEGNTVDIEVS